MKGSGGTRPRPNNERGRRRRRRRRRPSRRAQEVCRDGNSSSSNDTRTRWHLAGSCANSSGPSLFEEWASSLAGAYLLCHTHTHTHTLHTHRPVLQRRPTRNVQLRVFTSRRRGVSFSSSSSSSSSSSVSIVSRSPIFLGPLCVCV